MRRRRRRNEQIQIPRDEDQEIEKLSFKRQTTTVLIGNQNPTN